MPPEGPDAAPMGWRRGRGRAERPVNRTSERADTGAYGHRTPHLARRRLIGVRATAIGSFWRRTTTLRAVVIFLLLGMVPLALLTYFSTHLAENALRQEVENQVRTATHLRSSRPIRLSG